MGRESHAGAELRNRAAENVDERAGRVPVVEKLGEPGGCIPDSTGQPKGVSRLAAGTFGNMAQGAADRRHSEHPGCARRQRNRVAADQWKAIALARGLDAAEEIILPLAGTG